MLTAENKEYILTHYATMTANAMANAIGVCRGTINRFLDQHGLVPVRKRVDAFKCDFVCKPPQSCFICPYKDCTRDVFSLKQTQGELDFFNIGMGSNKKRRKRNGHSRN